MLAAGDGLKSELFDGPCSLFYHRGRVSDPPTEAAGYHVGTCTVEAPVHRTNTRSGQRLGGLTIYYLSHNRIVTLVEHGQNPLSEGRAAQGMESETMAGTAACLQTWARTHSVAVKAEEVLMGNTKMTRLIAPREDLSCADGLKVMWQDTVQDARIVENATAVRQTGQISYL